MSAFCCVAEQLSMIVRPREVFSCLYMAATLAHELAHAVTHDACAGMPRHVCEVVAESVVYAVCSRFGLDLSLRSVDYVAGWLDDPEAFRVGMAAIHDGAAALIDAIEAAMTDGDEVQLAA